MKKPALEAAIIFILVLAAAAEASVHLVRANPVIPPDIEVYHPQSKVYGTGEVELNFVAPSKFVLENLNFTSFSYSLDSKPNMAISGNTTLTGVSWGSHSIVVHGIATDGSTRSSQTVYFDVFCSTSWLVLITVAIAIVAVVCVGIFAYWRKIKQEDAFVKLSLKGRNVARIKMIKQEKQGG